MEARQAETGSFDWSDLQLFLAVARGGTLAAAAAALRVDASTVHRRIATLEASLRTRLFARSPRGYALTSSGQDLLPYATAIDDQAAAARRKLAASDDSLTGTVRVSATEDLADILAPIVASFRDEHPGVGVTVDMANAFVDLARQHADVAVRISSRPPEGDLIAKHVARLGLAFYGSRAYFARHGRPRRVEDLRDHAIVRGDVSLPWLAGERTLDAYARPERTAFRSRSFVARRAAVRDGVGIGVLGRFMGDAEEQLERLPFAVSDTNVNIWLLIHVDLRQNARVRAFTEHAHAALLAQRAFFEGQGASSGRGRTGRKRGRAAHR